MTLQTRIAELQRALAAVSRASRKPAARAKARQDLRDAAEEHVEALVGAGATGATGGGREAYVQEEGSSDEEEGGMNMDTGYCTQPEDFDAVMADVRQRRREQDATHGGEAHDDTHYYGDWVRFINKYAQKAYASAVRDRLGVVPGAHGDDYEAALVDIAALAIAAIQSHRRVKHRGRQ